MRTPIVRSFIMCEHIREEMRGKLTLVGTYADTIEIKIDDIDTEEDLEEALKEAERRRNLLQKKGIDPDTA